MTNKKPQLEINRVAKGVDFIVMWVFALGVLVVVALFSYVLFHEYFN